MTEPKSYPSFRVFFGLTMSPALVGLFMGLIIVFNAIAAGRDAPHFWFWIVFLFPFMALASLWYGAPAALLGAIVIILRLYRGFRAYAIVSTLGGATAIFWSVTIRLIASEPLLTFKLDLQTVSVFPYIPIMNDMVIFLVGACASFFMALLVLPRRL